MARTFPNRKKHSEYRKLILDKIVQYPGITCAKLLEKLGRSRSGNIDDFLRRVLRKHLVNPNYLRTKKYPGLVDEGLVIIEKDKDHKRNHVELSKWDHLWLKTTWEAQLKNKLSLYDLWKEMTTRFFQTAVENGFVPTDNNGDYPIKHVVLCIPRICPDGWFDSVNPKVDYVKINIETTEATTGNPKGQPRL